MSSSARFLAVILLSLVCVPLCLQAQSPVKPVVKTPRGSVSGRVTVKDKPAPGIAVALRLTNNMVPTGKFYKGVTDNDGFYRISNVPPGTYDIAPAAPAYVNVEIASVRGKSVIVGDDENVEDINFSLIRGGVITGKVTDNEGRPLIQHLVNLYRVNDLQSQTQTRQVFAAANVQTDDRGIYRFFGLTAGRYKVACGRGDDTYVTTNNQSSRIVYKQVFHPNETDQAKATVIDVREGSEATNVDITLGVPLQTFRIAGRVIDGEKGMPIANVRLGFLRTLGERFEMIDSSSISNARGEFMAEGLVPGRYSVVLYPSENRELRAETMSFDVVDQDINALTVRLIKGSTVSGVVVLESEDKKAWAKLREFQLRAYVTAAAGAPVAGQTNWSPIAADGTFRIAGMSPGRANLWLNMPVNGNPPKGFNISRVEYNGVVLPQGLEIREGDHLEGVRVYVSYGTGIVRGAVKIENGPLADGARLFVRLFKPGTPPMVVANSMADARGQFMFEGLAPGMYEVTASGAMPTRRIMNSQKREISVQDGVVTEVTITLDLAPPPGPPPPPKP